MASNLTEALDRVVKQRGHIEPLLRPHQARDLDDEIMRVEAQMAPPTPGPYAKLQEITRGRIDQNQQRKERIRLRGDRERLTPQAFAGPEMDEAVKLEREMRERLTAGMLTQEDMRRCPPGAVDRHLAWERKHKREHALWQNLRLRLRASGETFGDLENDVANLEVYRPKGFARSLDMAGAQINRPDWHIPANLTPSTLFSDAEEAELRRLSPLLADSLSTATNEQRARIKTILTDALIDAAAKPAPAKAAVAAKSGRKPMSAEARKAAGDRLRAMAAAKRAAKQAG